MAVLIGIDGGGSSSTARAETADGVVLAEVVGPGTNPQSISAAVVTERFRVLLDGLPHPAGVAACISGMNGEWSRGVVRDALREVVPGAEVHLAPDFTAALLRFDPPVDACAIAGTGSIVCGPDERGDVVTTGGLGPLLGERGSAAALGRAAVARYLDDPASVHPCAHELEVALGEPREALMGAVYRAAEPSTLLARAAPVVTRAAEAGEPWARTLLDDEVAALAATVARHLRRHRPGARRARLGIAGGLWRSPAAVDAFAATLPDALRAAGLDPVDGVDLARPARSAAAAAVALARHR